MRVILAVLGALGGLLFCSCTRADWAAAAQGFNDGLRTVTITLRGAVIAPSKADGSPWDGDLRVPDNVRDQVTQKLLGSGVRNLDTDAIAAAAIVYVGTGLLDQINKPDVYGAAVVVGTNLQVPIQKEENTYTPNGWGVTFSRVNWSSQPRVEVVLKDADELHDDLIGDVVISTDDLKNALAAGKPYDVRVDDQSNGQLLYLSIVVTADNWTP